MTVAARIHHLEEEHKKLENQIKDAYTHFQPDTNVADLKKKKLSIKEKIELLRKDNAQ